MRGTFILLALATLATACGDPVHDMQREALGGEVDGVPKGPLHRPGQPCLVCHSDYGPAHMVLSFGGTVYEYQYDTNLGDAPLANASITLTDQTGRSYLTATNCAGNFFVQRADFDPVFPVSVRLEYGNLPHIPQMTTRIRRDGSCASCHYEPIGPRSPGRVYAQPVEASFPPQGCP